MQPNQNQYSIDYLNQIAPAVQKPAPNKWFVIGGIVAFLAIVIISMSFLMKARSGGPTEDLQRLSIKLAKLQAVSDNAQSNIKNGAIRTTNSNLSIFLADTNRSVAEQVKKAGIETDKIDEKLAASESNAKIDEALEDARLNTTYDSVYVREISLKLTETTILMSRIYEQSKDDELRQLLSSTDISLQSIRKQFNLSAASDSIIN